MSEDTDLIDSLRRLASVLPREASPLVEQQITAAFRSRHPRKRRIWVYAAVAAVLVLGLTVLRQHFAAGRDYVVYASGFVALPYAQSGVPMESVVVIRVQMRASELSSMGVAVPAAASTARLTADVLVGQDGVARAVRLVE